MPKRFSYFDKFELPEDCKEYNSLPSMVEECYNPSIADIINNPTCLLRPRPCMYDDGDSLEEVETSWDNDIQNTYVENVCDDIPAPKARKAGTDKREGTTSKKDPAGENGEPRNGSGEGSGESQSSPDKLTD